MKKQPWMLPAALVTAVVVVLAGIAGVVWWRSEHQAPKTQPAPADQVAVAVPHAPKKLTIGVIVTLSSKPGQGSEWKYAAEGAQVAAKRLSMGGVDVTLKTVDDKGTTAGAGKAVEKLAKDDVTGIVVASEGSHLKGAVAAAEQAGLPLLLPYESDPSLLGDHDWATGPTAETIGATLADAIRAADLSRPLVINAGGGVPDGVQAADELPYKSGDDTDKLIKTVRKLSGAGDDCVIISGPATVQATVVQALQGGGISLPVYLTPDATSPAFTSALVTAGGTLSTTLNSVGPDWDDAASLRSDDAGRAMASFLAAVRLQAADDQQQSLMGDQPFADIADQADVRSHDAVIALARAAGAAGSGTAADVAAALSGLTLSNADGLAGPTLDFSSDTVLDPQAVVALRSSDQDLGLRPQGDEARPRLIWFAAPTTK